MNRPFFWRKLHSLSGVLPIGVFLIEHMFINSMAIQGPDTFNRGVALLHSIPYLWALELFIVFAPILYHAIYGIWVVYLTRNNFLNYRYFRNWLFYLQRVTALISLAFVAWHIGSMRFANGITGNNADYYTFVAHALRNPLVLVLYSIGLLATFGHFSNGLWSFLITWGITIGERAQRITAYVGLGIFIILAAVGLNAIAAFI